MTTLTRTHVAAAAPLWIRDLLAAETTDALVLHSGPEAVYVQMGEHCNDVIAVLSRHAIAVPCALHTQLSSTAELTLDRQPPAPGTRVAINHERLHFTGASVHIARTVSHTAPAIDAALAPRMARRLASALGTTTPGHAELPADGLRALAAADPRAVVALLGLGSGLTPLGDDVLCGWLAAMVAASHSCAARVSERALALADERTTALSATLLRRAARAEVVPPFARVLHALAARPESATAAVHDLTRIGHTSGFGLALGLGLALDHLGSRSTCS